MFNNQMMQRVQQLMQSNPQLATLMQKPGLMQKIQAIVSNPNDPTIAQQYMSDPDVQQLMNIIGPGLGMNNMGMGNNNNNMMNNMGMGNNNNMGYNIGGNNNNNNNQQGNSLVTYITSESQFFDILSTTKDKLIIVDWFATWCGPCKMVAPEFERLAKLYRNKAVFIKIDVDRNKSLAQRKKIVAMPTFHFYKNKQLIEELRGASIRKLESLITKHIYSSNVVVNQIQKASPYKNFPLHEKNRPVYAKTPFKKMIDKLNQLNNKFIDDEADDNNINKYKYSLNDSEWKLLKQILAILQDKGHYHDTEFNINHYKLFDKLLTWPQETLPPVLDLIRVLSLHPSFAKYCSTNFNFVDKITKIGGNGLINAVNGMITCRIINNLFNRRIMFNSLEIGFNIIISNLINNMMCITRKNTRLAFVRVLLHYSYCFYVLSYNKSNKSDLYRSKKLKCLSLLNEILFRENEKDIILNILMSIGTLIFRDENIIQFGNSLDLQMVFKSYKQKFNNSKDIGNCCTELIQALQNPDL